MLYKKRTKKYTLLTIMAESVRCRCQVSWCDATIREVRRFLSEQKKSCFTKDEMIDAGALDRIMHVTKSKTKTPGMQLHNTLQQLVRKKILRCDDDSFYARNRSYTIRSIRHPTAKVTPRLGRRKKITRKKSNI